MISSGKKGWAEKETRAFILELKVDIIWERQRLKIEKIQPKKDSTKLLLLLLLYNRQSQRLRQISTLFGDRTCTIYNKKTIKDGGIAPQN